MSYEIVEYQERIELLNEIAALEYWEYPEALIYDLEGVLL